MTCLLLILVARQKMYLFQQSFVKLNLVSHMGEHSQIKKRLR